MLPDVEWTGVDWKGLGLVIAVMLGGIGGGMLLRAGREGKLWPSPQLRRAAGDLGFTARGGSLHGELDGRPLRVLYPYLEDPRIVLGRRPREPVLAVTDHKLDRDLDAGPMEEAPARTGDAEFDRRFVVRSRGSGRAARLPADLRRALLEARPLEVLVGPEGVEYVFEAKGPSARSVRRHLAVAALAARAV